MPVVITFAAKLQASEVIFVIALISDVDRRSSVSRTAYEERDRAIGLS